MDSGKGSLFAQQMVNVLLKNGDGNLTSHPLISFVLAAVIVNKNLAPLFLGKFVSLLGQGFPVGFC